VQYAWRCFVCDEANVSTASVCAACGFPACATGADIAAAKAAKVAREAKVKARRPAVRQDSAIESFADALSPLPPWRQFIAICGALMSLGGCIWLKVTFSLVGTMWSIVALVVGVALIGLACAGLESSPSSGRRAGSQAS
jgi:hypothetical protein